jgi:lysyl endopeptidase
MKQKSIIMGLAAVLLIHCELISQVSSRRVAKGDFPKFLNSRNVSQIPTISIEAFDLEKINQEDSEDSKLGNEPRFGRPRKVDIGINSGIWSNSQLGKHWQISIRSPKAKGFMLVFDEFILPEGAELFIYNARKTILMGAITHESNNKSQRFSSDLIEGDSIVLELIESPRAFNKTKLHLESVLYVYSLPFKSEVNDGPSDIIPLESCQRDVRCPEGNNWVAQSNAVAMIFDPIVGRWCTGTLLNNACNNLNPTFLTAFHCADFDKTLVNGVRVLNAGDIQKASDWVFRFGYKTVTCGGGDNPQWQTISNCVVSAQSENSDGLLLQLNSRPNAQSGINYAGWTTNIANISQVTILEHPLGHPMKIAVTANNQAPIFQTVQLNDGGNGFTVINSIRPLWNTGVTQGGASGSSYFDQNQRVVAQHSGGFGTCANRRASGGTIANAFPNGFGAVLTNDPAVTQTNTIGIPSLNLPDVICGFVPLTNNLVNWNGITGMGLAGGSLGGIQGSNQGFGLEPIPGYSGAGFLTLQYTPSGITCNTPLIIRKDFFVGVPAPQVSFEDDGGCFGWLSVGNTRPGDTYFWEITRNGYTYYKDLSVTHKFLEIKCI